MTEKEPEHLSSRIADDDVQRLLRRAAELDAQRSATLSYRELQGIATEAGISSSALEQAWSELNENRPALQPPASFLSRLKTRVSDWATATSLAIQTTGVALVSFVSGFLTAPPEPNQPLTTTVVLSVTAFVVASLALAVHGRRKHDQQRFQTQLLVLWLFYWYGTLNGAPSVPDQYFLTLHGICWASLAVIGALIVGHSARNASSDTPETDASFA